MNCVRTVRKRHNHVGTQFIVSEDVEAVLREKFCTKEKGTKI